MAWAGAYPDSVGRLVLANTAARFTESIRRVRQAIVESYAGEPWFADALAAQEDHEAGRYADVAEFKAQPYLVDSTKALEKARFIPTDANYGKVIDAIQKATGRVAAGEMSADAAAKRYTDDLKQAVGADKVITQQ